jgi:chromosome segregation ATPase
MARGGINKAVVEKARDALLAKGLNPSIDAIRVELGNTGSKSTIHRYLKELEQAQGTLSEGMGSISDELTHLVQSLAQRLHDEAQARIDAAQETFDEQRGQLQTEAKEHAGRAEALQQALVRSEEALAQTLAQLSETQASAQAEQTRNARLAQACEDLEARLADKQQQVASLEDKHQHAREALEHYRVASREQREQEQRRHEGQLQQAQAELRQAQQGLVVRQEELTRLNRDNERLLSALAQSELARTQAAEHGAALQAEVARLAALQGQAQGAREVLATQLAELRDSLRVTGERSQAQADELAEAKARGRLLEEALAEARAALRPPASPEVETPSE